MNLFRESDDYHGYLRACACCRQPWKPLTSTVNDHATLKTFQVEQKYKELNAKLQTTKLFFAENIEKGHIIQHAHQFAAYEWACSPTNRIRDANVSVVFDPTVWGTNNPSFEGRWDASPLITCIRHTQLRKFIFENNKRLSGNPSLPETLLTCKRCNQIMDTKLKIRWFIFGNKSRENSFDPGIMPVGRVKVVKLNNNTEFFFNERSKNSTAQKNLGVLCAWYHYVSFLYLSNEIRDTTYQPMQWLCTTLAWLAFTVALKYQDMVHPSRNSTHPKFCYVGMLNLYISLFMYVCFQAEFPEISMSFIKFYTFYMLDITDCKVSLNFWDSRKHPFLHSFLFDDLVTETTRTNLIEKVSDSLVNMYKSKIRLIIYQVFVARPTTPLRANVLQKFFITLPELAVLYNEIPKEEKTFVYFSLQSYVNNLGITVMLWQYIKNLQIMRFSPSVKPLYAWLLEVIHKVEHINVARNGLVQGYILHEEQAAVVYRYQYIYSLPQILEKEQSMIRMLQTNDLRALNQRLPLLKRCSVFKGFIRLLSYKFNEKKWKGILPKKRT